MKHIILTLTLILCAVFSFAQELKVKSFTHDAMNRDAQINPRADLNGRQCALLKVMVADKITKCEGGNVGAIVDEGMVKKIYISPTAKYITLYFQNHFPVKMVFADYVTTSLQSMETYELVLLDQNPGQQSQQAQGNFLVMTVTPANASVKIDDVLVPLDSDGSLKRFLPNGQHRYSIDAGDAYSPVSGTIEMNGERLSLPFTLQSLKALLSVNTQTSGSKIYVNEDYKGTDQWRGSLSPGTYLVEARKDGCRPASATVTLSNQQTETVTLPALQQIFGSLMVDYEPVDADVYLDNRLLGKTPNVFSNISVGKHSVKISKAGYTDYNGSVTIDENRQATVSGSLKRSSSNQNSNSFVQSSDTDTDTPEKLYQKGLSFYNKKDYSEAVKWYHKAAEQGDAKAQFNLGYCYEKGQGVSQNYSEAVKWYRKAAEQGYAKAQYNLGLCYDNGRGVSQDYSEAVKWYRKAADQGDTDAQNNLGYCYKYGQGVSQDYSEAVKWYRKAAEQGNASAQCNLGYCYQFGQGVSQNYTEAVKWYRKAAEQGYASAQNNLGYCYKYGQGVSQDYTEAVKWYRKAAEQGDAAAQYNLGLCYDNGRGVSQDYSEAVKWYRKAAEQGNASAQHNLGCCYDNGQGVSQDYTEAVKWYRKAAEQGYASAQCNLGYCYKYGQGVSQDYSEAVKWYRKAAEQGSASAQYSLGLCYQYGHGVSQDYSEAVKWYRKAAEQGHANAQKQLESLKNKLR